MRPVKLTIQAFGAYVQDRLHKPVEIDFTKLGRKGLFLVTGDTGAGKTTLFDAITYALFGKTSGGLREGSMMRSTYAPADVKTFVELEFEYDGKHYTVRREPAQARPKERGEGLTSVSESATLIIEGNAPITSLKEVNARLTEILGVSFEQYSQISMIAQGKFRELLDADTKERSEIFRTIFKTANFQLLQSKLKDEACALYSLLSNERRSAVQYVDGAVCMEASEYSAILTNAKELVGRGLMTIADARQIIKDILNSDLLNQETNRNELKGVEDELQKISSGMQILEAYNRNKDSLDRQTAERDRMEAVDKPALHRALAEAESHRAEIEELNGGITRMRLVMDNYSKFTECNRLIAENGRLMTAATDSLRQEKEAISKLEQKINASEEELKAIKDPASEIATIHARQDTIESDVKRIGEINAAYGKYRSDCARLPEMLQSVRNRENAWLQKNEEYNEKHHLFIAEQAGYLAEELEQGKPCPVCGSLHHPAPATKAAAAPTKAQLDLLWTEVGKLKQAAESASNEYSTKSGSVEAEKNSLMSNAANFIGEVTIEELPVRLKSISDGLAAEYDANKSHMVQLNRLKQRREELERNIPSDRKSLQSLIEEESRLKEERVRLQSESVALNEKLSELRRPLSYASEAEARKALADKESGKLKLEKAIESATNDLNGYLKSLAAIDGSISELTKLTQTVPAVNKEALTTRRTELTDRKIELEKTRDALVTNIRINEGVISNIDRTSGKLSALEEEYRWKNALAQTANGELAGKEKINFETFVQMAFFDRILQRANTRLMIMSGGQYELRRSGSSKGKAQAGLNIDVLDHYNGSTRSVKSLSGGESFMSALSLALGLSDEIQASAGGIRLDTMFVDEGFGSLDEESLGQALKALNALTAGDRLIGIISHVAELKKIEKQIVVTKDKLNYSQVTVNA